MRMILCVAVGIVIDIPDEESAVGAPLANNPLDELAARLRREACCGRDYRRPDFTSPDVTAWKTGAYGEYPTSNETYPGATAAAQTV
jgi:hypothetical protein